MEASADNGRPVAPSPLSAPQEATLSAGKIRYRDVGAGPAIVFVHGFAVDGTLWTPVVERLQRRARCVVPDWPLGSHPHPMRPDADLSPRGVATLIDEFLWATDLDDVTLVANDTGGAIAQLLVTERPERVARLVLTNCDCFENFFPLAFRPMQWLAKAHLLGAALQPMRFRAPRRLPNAYGRLMRHPLDEELIDGWVRPFLGDRRIRRDASKLLRGVDSRDTLAAAEKLRDFDRPTLIAWGEEDRFFKPEHGRRLAELIPNARYVGIPDAFTFVSLDAPERVSELIEEFVQDSVPAAS